MTKFFFPILLFLVLVANAQKKAINVSDFAAWNRLENRQISMDGRYVAYEVNPLKGDGLVVVNQVASNTNDTLRRAADLRFVPSMDVVVYRIKVPVDSLRKHKIAKTKKELLPKDSVGIFNLLTKQKIVYANLHSLAVPDENASSVVMLLDKKKEDKKDKSSAVNDSTTKKKAVRRAPVSSVDKDRELFDLIVFKPFAQQTYKFERVDMFQQSAKGNLLTFVSKMNDTTKVNVLVCFDTQTCKTDTIVRDSVSFKKLTVDELGTQFAYLWSRDTAKVKVYDLSLFNVKMRKSTLVADTIWIHKGVVNTPSEYGSVFFSKDGSKLFFGLAPKPVTEPKDTIPEDEKPRLDVWSHTDNVLQPKQLKAAADEKSRSSLALYRIEDKKLVLLADSVLKTVILINKNNGEKAIAADKSPYERMEVWDMDVPADHYIIDLKTGDRKKVLSSKNQVWLSPSGNFTLWFERESNSYWCLNNKTMKTLELTNGMAVSFVDEQNDVPAYAKPYGITGWSANDEFVYVNDRFDVWKLDLKAKNSPVNITNGRSRNMTFRYQRTNPDEVFVPSKGEMLFFTFNVMTQREGIASLVVNSNKQPTMLVEGDFMLSGLVKAQMADTYIWSKQTAVDYPEISISTGGFVNSKVISTTNPKQQNFNWLTVERVRWTSFAGDTLSGLLYKPENFDASRKYPLMVYFYERNSENIHRHAIPSPSRSIISIPHYCSNEYLVFVPDIVYKTGYPGQGAYDAIVSGVYHLINTNKSVDAKRMALQGQSWGGYQIAYLITQTNLFAAAMAGAPVSNMTSAYGGIRWGTGNSRMFQYEKTQSRIGGTLWEKPMHFIENSPLFMAPKVNTPLLIMANDNDGSVPWYQGIEFFMALYRLNKPVWMLNYNGMDHNLEEKYWANRMDLTVRMMSFFDHYLKNKPAPEWMVKGIPAVDKGRKLGY